ncbi:MFS general substrate transporter [Stipitochalara longipes BDJ]|nr:MFS general substrate transporter [Stipitochalara longipes BDJ]
MQSFLQYRRIKASLIHDVEIKPSTTPAEMKNEETQTSHIIVSFENGTDPVNPLNWSTGKKIQVMSIISLVAFLVGFGSSIDAPVIPQAKDHFGVSAVAESLATALYLIGFGAGAPFAGPISETSGRNAVYISTFALFCIWIMGAALAPNFGAQLVFRFLAGFCGSTPFTTAGGTLGDIYSPAQRAKLFPSFAFIAFAGPTLAPVVGGYVGVSGISWRWTEWITLILSGSTLVLLFLFLPETYAPILLKWKAEHLRTMTRNDQYRAPIELANHTFLQKVITALTRPVTIFFTEPIVVVLTLYLTFVYSVTFSFFSSYPWIFGETYRLSQGGTYIMFLGIVFGLILVLLLTPLWGRLLGMEFARAARNGQGHPPPEAMLWWAMVASPFIPISLFWMGWSAYPSVSYWSPLIGSVPFGFALLCIFISTYAYIMQTFAQYAASALVFVTFVRYICGGAMVVVAIPMFENLGVHHAMTILGAVSCLFVPVPFVLYFWGAKIRAKSRNAPQNH